jgi:hypothetical protein
MWYISKRRKIHTGFFGGNLKERDHLEELGPCARTVLVWVLNKYDRRARMRSSWLSIGTSGGLL